MTSCPCSLSRAAAAEESTPPDSATTTRITSRCHNPPFPESPPRCSGNGQRYLFHSHGTECRKVKRWECIDPLMLQSIVFTVSISFFRRFQAATDDSE